MHERLKQAEMQASVRHMRDELVGLYRHSVMIGSVNHQLHPEPDLQVSPSHAAAKSKPVGFWMVQVRHGCITCTPCCHFVAF